MRHVPLAEYLNAVLSTGLVLEHFEEPGEAGVPHTLAVRATRAA